MSDKIGAIAGMVGQLGGQLISNAGTARQNRKNRAFQADENQKGRDFAQSMFDQTNAFNLMTSDPSFQMKRWKDAGLNPWLMYGNPQEVKANATSPSGVSALPAGENSSKYDLGSVVKDFYNLMATKAQIKNIEADTAKKDAEAGVASATQSSVVQDVNQKAQLFGGQLDLQTGNVQLLKTQNQKAVEEVQNLATQRGLTTAQTQNIKQETANKIVEAENLRKEGKLKDAQRIEKEIGNRIIESTSASKIQAENAKNKFDADTSGVGKTSAWNLSGSLIGAAIKAVKESVQAEKVQRKSEWSNKSGNGLRKNPKTGKWE